jgi:HlyD family secretion protein
MKRILLMAVVLGVVALALVASTNLQTGNGDTPADTLVVQPTDLEIAVVATGSVRPLRDAALRFGATNVVAEILVEEGQTVAAGDVLARLSTSDLDVALRDAETRLERQRVRLEDLETPAREIDIQAAEAALAVARADTSLAYDAAPSDEALTIAQLEIEQAQNNVWQSQLQRDMRVQLSPEFRENDTNDAEAEERLLLDSIERSELGVTIAETEYNRSLTTGPDLSALGSAQAALVRAQILIDNLAGTADARDLNIAALSLESAARVVEDIRAQYDNFTLVAPFDGVITTMNLTVGELPPSDAAVVIADTSGYLAELDVDENDVVALNLGLPANIRVDALPESNLNGEITFISPTLNPDDAVPTYRVKLSLDRGSAPVRSNMSVTASITVERLTDVLALPNRYINETGVGATVTVLENEETREVPVTLGRRSGDLTEIVSGLAAGQTVVPVLTDAR